MQAADIVAWLTAHGKTEIDIDDLVHDAFMDGTCPALNEEPSDRGQEGMLQSAEQDVSDINNGGLNDQIAYLVRYYRSAEDAAEAIAEALKLPPLVAA